MSVLDCGNVVPLSAGNDSLQVLLQTAANAFETGLTFNINNSFFCLHKSLKTHQMCWDNSAVAVCDDGDVLRSRLGHEVVPDILSVVFWWTTVLCSCQVTKEPMDPNCCHQVGWPTGVTNNDTPIETAAHRSWSGFDVWSLWNFAKVLNGYFCLHMT